MIYPCGNCGRPAFGTYWWVWGDGKPAEPNLAVVVCSSCQKLERPETPPQCPRDAPAGPPSIVWVNRFAIEHNVKKSRHVMPTVAVKRPDGTQLFVYRAHWDGPTRIGFSFDQPVPAYVYVQTDALVNVET